MTPPGGAAAGSNVHIVHPGNPFAVEPDGIVSVQRNFMASAPQGFRFDYWGVERSQADAGRDGADARGRFHGVVRAKKQRPLVPVSLSFAAGMVRHRHDVRAGVVRLDRIESALPLAGLRVPKALFLHTWNVRDNRDPASESRWKRLAPVYDALFHRVVRAMDLVYVLRPDMAEDLRRTVPQAADRIRPFSVPIDLDVFRPLTGAERAAVRAELVATAAVPAGAPLAIFAGRIEGQKRPLAIPEVLAALKVGLGIDAHVLVVGDGSLVGALRRAAEGGAPGRVHIVPPVAQSELRRYLGAADALLLPSAFEGLPNVMLESLACGTPVIAARGPGRIGEVLSDHAVGRVTEPDAAGLAGGLADAFSRPADHGACRAIAEPFGAAAVNAPIYEDFERLAAGSAVSPSSSG